MREVLSGNRSFIALLALMLLLSVPVSPARADWSGTSSDTQISYDDNEYARYVRLAVDPFDVIHAVWCEDNPTYDEVHYGRSTDGGATWSGSAGDNVISYDDNEAAYQSPDIAIDSQGWIFVVWNEDQPESGFDEVLLTMSTDGGGSWSAPSAGDVVISDPLQDDENYYPNIVADPDDHLHVVYSKTDPGVGYAKVYTSRSTDRGASWSAPLSGDQAITDVADPHSDYSADIAVDSSGTLYVCYEKYLGSGVGNQVYITRSTDGGLTWSGTAAETAISTVFYAVNYPRIAVDANDIIHVVWQGSGPVIHYEYYHSRSTDGGVTWSGAAADQPVSFENAGGDSAFNGSIAADHCGGLCVAWDEAPVKDGVNEIMVSCSTDGGVTWSGSAADELISFPDGENGYRPALAALADNTWIGVWTEFNGSSTNNYEVHLSVGDPLCEASTVGCSYTCVPGAGTVPFVSGMTVTLDNLYTGQRRRVAGRVDVTLAGGGFLANWRRGYTNILEGDSYQTSWPATIPALGSVIGDNRFTLTVEDVTPAPFNQPPYPPSGDTDTDTCTVTGVAP